MKTIWIINQYASTPETGSANRHSNLARELGALGHEVMVVAARWHHKLSDERAAAVAPLVEERDGYKFVRLTLPYKKGGQDPRRALNWVHFAWKLVFLDRKLGSKPDIVYYSSPGLIGYLGAERLARRVEAKLVFEVRDIWPLTLTEFGNKSSSHPLIRLMQWVEDRAYRNSDHLVSNLPFAEDHMIARGATPGKFSWIPNGISASMETSFEPLSKEVEMELPKQDFLVGYTGALIPAVSIATLIQAANLLRDEPNIGFVIVGRGRCKPMLQQKVRELGLNNVTFVDLIPKLQVPAILERFSAVYLGMTASSLYRFGVSPNKLFDYLLSSRPIIYSVDSGAYQPVKTHEAGIQIQPEEPKELAAAIKKLCATSEEERQRMGRNGKTAVLEHYEFKKLAAKLDREVISILGDV